MNNYIPASADFFDPKDSETEFFIREEFLTDVPVTYRWGKDNSTLGHVDHPSFAALRQMLGKTGRIKIQTLWWNGDTVTKEFSLNGHKFLVGEQFSCATAIKWTLKR